MKRCTLERAQTELGPRAAFRLGSECAAPRCARGPLRCSRRKGGCGTAVAALNAPRPHGVLAGPSPAAPDCPLRRCASRRPTFALAECRPRACDALFPSSNNTLVPSKAGVGCAPAATYAAPRSAGLRGSRVAVRRRVGHTLFEFRAQRRCVSSVAPARGRVCVAALAARAPQGSRPEGTAAAFERRRIPGRGFARSVDQTSN